MSKPSGGAAPCKLTWYTFRQTFRAKSRFALGCKKFCEFIQPNIQSKTVRRRLNKGQHHLGPVFQDVGAAPKMSLQCWQSLCAASFGPKIGNIIKTQNVDGKLGDHDGPTLLTRGARGKNSFIDAEAKKSFLIRTDVVSRKALKSGTRDEQLSPQA